MKYITPIFLCLLVISACKKDVIDCPQTSPTVSKNAHYPLEIGNYWIYEFQTYLPDGTITGTMTLDTLKVVGDTLIEDNSFFVIHTDKPTPNAVWYLRDNEGSILTKYGSMVLPPSPTEEIFNDHHYVLNESDTLFYYYDKFPLKEMFETNFGVEECMRQEATHIMFPLADNNEVVDISYFASFGPVQRSYAFISGTKMIGTLVDYHIE
jgi:hypothetical protein